MKQYKNSTTKTNQATDAIDITYTTTTQRSCLTDFTYIEVTH